MENTFSEFLQTHDSTFILFNSGVSGSKVGFSLAILETWLAPSFQFSIGDEHSVLLLSLSPDMLSSVSQHFDDSVNLRYF